MNKKGQLGRAPKFPDPRPHQITSQINEPLISARRALCELLGSAAGRIQEQARDLPQAWVLNAWLHIGRTKVPASPQKQVVIAAS